MITIILVGAALAFLWGLYDLFKNKTLTKDYFSARATMLRAGTFVYSAALVAITGHWIVALVVAVVGVLLTLIDWGGRSFEPKK